MRSSTPSWSPEESLVRRSDASCGRLYKPPPVPPPARPPGIEATSGDEMSGDEASKGDEFPVIMGSSAFVAGLIPKREIGAARFLSQHPQYDGRGVTIAVFDTGIDPAAAGLQVTPDGRPKIVDVLDCSGSGDVDTSTVVRADSEGFIGGASGARLQVNKSWKNPSGEWRVGSKLVYELFAKNLVSRVKKERKKRWTEVHREAITAAFRQLAAFEQKHTPPLDPPLRKAHGELLTRLDLLHKLSSSYEDKGPVIDAVVWHDGEVFRVALDTQDLEEDSGSGKLADFSPLTNYRIERKYGTFSRLDACSFVTNVYNEGNVLSIVTDGASHGTHVAGIAAAYHPEEPLLNGVAPGAQLVSCKIGDSRVGLMETGVGLTRALIAVLENKCDLINMSFGEPTTTPNYGRFIDLAEEVVNKHGVIFVSSAGNNGPCLSTVKAPGCTSCIVSVGAYLSPEMASEVHSFVRPPAQGLQYTSSSRGPTPDGDLGVALSAPGAAVAPVSKWTRQGRMLLNGTSMASPCACGGVALLLSSLKAQGQVISPHVVREALENTATKVHDSPDEPLTTGRGLLQVDLAYEYLQKSKERPSVLYKIQLHRSGGSDATLRGVYLRDVHDSRQASEWSVSVQPEFHEDADNMDLLVPFQERLHLQSSHPDWLKCPEYLYLTNNGRRFHVVVDPTQLPEGLHYAEVVGTDLEAPWRGPSFRVPVTVIKPMELQSGSVVASFEGLSFTPGHIERRFVVVPEGANWAELSLRVHGFDTPRRFYLHTVQLSSKNRPSTWGTNPLYTYPSSQNFMLPIKGGLTMELTLALSWQSGIGSDVPAIAELQLEFHGIQPSQEEVFINGNETVTRVDVKAPLATEWLSPSATLTKVRVPYRPAEFKLEPLSALRDKLSNGRQINALTLTYKFSLAERAEVTPCLSYLKMRLYDTEFESQLYMIFDSNKRLLASGDCYPKGVRLSKGDYVLRMYIRHDNMSYLEKLKNIPLLLERRLEEKNQVRLNFYSNIDGPVTGAGLLRPKLLAPGEIQPVFIGVVGDEKLPMSFGGGTVLVGSVKWGKFPCPASSGLSYVVPLPHKMEPKPIERGPEEKKSISVRLEEEVRDFKIRMLSSLPTSTTEEQKEWDDLALSLRTDHPKHLPLRMEILQRLAAKSDSKARVIQAADDVVALIDKDALAKHFGLRREIDDPSAAQVHKDMDMQLNALADALYRKGLAIFEKEEQEGKDSPANLLAETVEREEGPKAVAETKEPESNLDGGIPIAAAEPSVKQEANAVAPPIHQLEEAVEANGVAVAKEPESSRSLGGEEDAVTAPPAVQQTPTHESIRGENEAAHSVKQEANGAIVGEMEAKSSVKEETTNGSTLAEKEAKSSVKEETTNGSTLAEKEAISPVKQETTHGAILQETKATSSVKQETTNGEILAEKEPAPSDKQESNGATVEEREASSPAKKETNGSLAKTEAALNQETNGEALREGEAPGVVKQEASGALLGNKVEAPSVKQENKGEEEATPSVRQEATDRANPGGEKDEFEENFAELRKWVDIGALKFFMLTIKREMRAGRNGSAIKALQRLIHDESKPPQKHLYELRIQLIEKAGWTHWASYEKKWLAVRFPSGYPLF